MSDLVALPTLSPFTFNAHPPSLFDDVPIGLYRTTPDGQIVDCNTTFVEMLGYPSREAMLNCMAHDLYPNLSTRRQWQAKLETTRGAYHVEKQLRRFNGELLWVRDTTRVMRDGHGQAVFYDGYLEDITEVKQRELEVSAIGSLSAALRSATSRAEMLPLLVNHVRDLFHAEGASLSMEDPLTRSIKIEAGSGSGAQFIGSILPLGVGVTGRVIATGEAYLTHNAPSDPLFAWPHLLGDLKAVACVPLKTDQHVIGALWVGRIMRLTPPELRVLTAIADIAANAITRISAHDSMERNLQRLQALRAIDSAITNNLDLAAILNIVLEKMQTHLSVEAGAVLRLNSDKRVLEFVAGRGFKTERITKLNPHLGEGCVGQAALQRNLFHLASLAQSDCPRSLVAQEEGFDDYYALPLIVKEQVVGVLEVFQRATLIPTPDWLNFLEALAGQAAIAIDNANLLDRLVHSNVELTLAYDATIEGWSRALDLRDKETEGHSQRVTEMAVRLAQEMALPPEDLVHLYRGALLHDIGKMGVPDDILRKPGPLTPEERLIMEQHPRLAYEMLAPIAYLKRALDIPYCHHEKWDGTGYPRGLRSEAIPLAARIFAIADVWDAMSADRPYRAGCEEAEVLTYIQSQAGKHFDPRVVAAVLRLKGVTPQPVATY